jgi:hypothetical protein
MPRDGEDFEDDWRRKYVFPESGLPNSVPMAVGRLNNLFGEGETILVVESTEPYDWAIPVWEAEARRD